MASQNSYCLVEEELSCPICFEEYSLGEKNRQPKLLLCLHTFCLACMESLRKFDGSLQCSICRTSHQVYRTKDLMDNYVVFEYLKVKQESDDEKLATHLKEEYEESMRFLKEQEERDAQLAREEEEKNKQEIERLRADEEKRRQEQERLELERIALEQAQREEARSREEEERRRLEEIERQMEEEHQSLEQERNIEDPYLQIRVTLTPNDSSEERESSSDSTDSQNDDDEESVDTDTDDDSFQDLESVEQTDHDDDSPTSVVDPDDYETLSSDDLDRYSTEVVSSDSEDDRGLDMEVVPSTLPVPVSENNDPGGERSPPSSPQPDMLSEEFSGVAQVKSSLKPQNPLSSLLPSVKCTERPDGSIIIIDSADEHTSDDEAKSCNQVGSADGRTFNDISALTNSELDQEIDSHKRNSVSEENNVSRNSNSIGQHPSPLMPSFELKMEDENCKLQ